MLGIAKTSPNVESAWQAAKYLYLSEQVARGLYETNGIISPVKRFWKEPFYDRGDPFFQGQAPGRLFIEVAPDVPLRASSPFNRFAAERMRDAVTALRDFAVREHRFTVPELRDEAHRQLRRVETVVQDRVRRNRFLAEAP
jgi:arabinosaccharide transport system substrate-binding protein